MPATRAVSETLYRLLPELQPIETARGAADIRLKAVPGSLLLDPMIEAGWQAVRRVAEEGPTTDLPPDEALGAEAIIALTGRPALRVQGGQFSVPPTPWVVLEAHRHAIEQRLSSVGRIELSELPAITLVGTAFQVGPDLVMTNRHVAEAIATRHTDGVWKFISNAGPRIDYRAELPPAEPREYTLTEVVGVHAAEHIDLAILRVAAGDHSLPEPLPLVSEYDPRATANVYVVGHPAFDDTVSPERQDIQRLVFEGVFDVKRVAPGKVLGQGPEGVQYDSSTLGGNSGSCVLDLELDAVVALHYGGTYLKANYGVPLWSLRDDPLFRGLDLNFV